jgi:hypothetical protein
MDQQLVPKEPVPGQVTICGYPVFWDDGTPILLARIALPVRADEPIVVEVKEGKEC